MEKERIDDVKWQKDLDDLVNIHALSLNMATLLIAYTGENSNLWGNQKELVNNYLEFIKITKTFESALDGHKFVENILQKKTVKDYMETLKNTKKTMLETMKIENQPSLNVIINEFLASEKRSIEKMNEIKCADSKK